MSIFGDKDVVAMVKSEFVPLAVAIGAHSNAIGLEGELYRKIVAQRSTESFQGFYVFDAQSNVLQHEGGSRHQCKSVLEMLKKTSRAFRPVDLPPAAKIPTLDLGFMHRPPSNAVIVEVTSKLLEGYADAPELSADASLDTLGKGAFKLAVFNESLGRDRLWIRADEAAELKQGRISASLAQRIARFHLVDNTHCFPLFWEAGDVRKATMTLKDGVLSGEVHLETASGDRGYIAEICGRVETADDKVTRFDVVARGKFWGGKAKAGHKPPEGKFPLAVAFTLSDGKDPYDQVRPAGSKQEDYFK